MKEYIINISDNKKYDSHAQEVWSDVEKPCIEFYVKDFCDCPEDARIGRGLFDGYDFINAIKLGFEIAKSGYDEIVVNEVSW